MPKTFLGKLSVGLIVHFFLFFTALRTLVALGERGGEGFFSNPVLAACGILAAISGISAFFVGLAAVVRSRERSVFVLLAVAVGLFILIFVLGEILSPH